jgi:DUF438 domain-containing protein
MIEKLTKEQIIGILETIPIDISYVDENDTVRFWNKHETRVFKRPNAALGRTVQKCHPPKSVANVNRVIASRGGKSIYGTSG